MWALAALCAAFTMACCLAGVLSCRFRDNAAQTAGMTLTFFGTWPELQTLLEARSLDAAASSDGASACAHAGLALFCAGTAYKVWHHRRDAASGP